MAGTWLTLPKGPATSMDVCVIEQRADARRTFIIVEKHEYHKMCAWLYAYAAREEGTKSCPNSLAVAVSIDDLYAIARRNGWIIVEATEVRLKDLVTIPLRITAPVAGSPCQVGDWVVVSKAVERGVYDVAQHIGQEGKVAALRYGLTGETYPGDPLIEVELEGGKVEMFRPEELERAKLRGAVQGEPLRIRDLREMANGTYVWVTYRKEPGLPLTVNRPLALHADPDYDGTWDLKDAGTTVMQITPDSLKPEAYAQELEYGEHVLYRVYTRDELSKGTPKELEHA